MKGEEWFEADRDWRRKLAERQAHDDSIMENIFVAGVIVLVVGITALGTLWAIAEGWMK